MPDGKYELEQRADLIPEEPLPLAELRLFPVLHSATMVCR